MYLSDMIVKRRLPFQHYHTQSQRIAQKPIAITPVALNNLKDDFVRERNSISSTEFSFSRFIIPHLMNYRGYIVYGL